MALNFGEVDKLDKIRATELPFLTLTPDTIDAVVRLTGGAVKGIKLPVEERRVDAWQYGTEHEIEMGDTIVVIGRIYVVLGPQVFAAAFA